jgi:hypothetical protein
MCGFRLMRVGLLNWPEGLGAEELVLDTILF